MPNFFSTMRAIIGAVSTILGQRLWLGNYSFTLGSMFLGLVLISASATLLGILFKKD